jgi:hypothetical protein
MLKITKRISDGDNGVPSLNVLKHLGEKHSDVNLSETCLHFLQNMAGCFGRIFMYQNSVVIAGSELHVLQEISEKVFCNILNHAQWIDKVKIDVGFKLGRRSDTGYKKNQLTSLEVKSTVVWGPCMGDLLSANRHSIKIFKYKELKDPMYNLRVFEYNGDDIPKFSHYPVCPRLRKLVVPPNTPFRLWQINTVEKTILPQKNSAIYALTRSNTLRDEAIVYTLWGLKKNGFPKDVIRLIMPLVVAFVRECWRETAYKELSTPIEGWVISRHQPEMWGRKMEEAKRVKRELEETDVILQETQTKITTLQNTVGSLKEKLAQLKTQSEALLDEEITRLTKKQKTIVDE